MWRNNWYPYIKTKATGFSFNFLGVHIIIVLLICVFLTGITIREKEAFDNQYMNDIKTSEEEMEGKVPFLGEEIHDSYFR